MDRLPAHRRAVQAAFERGLEPGRRLAVTGATGWLGTALAEMAARAGLSDDGRLRLFASRPGRLALENGRILPLETLEGAAPLTGEGWTVVHFAGLGKERSAEVSPSTYLIRSDAILEATLRLMAAADRPRLVFASSGAAHGQGGTPPTLDTDPYGGVKIRHEAALTEWSRSKQAALTICRVFNVGGPYGNKLDLYALSSLIRSALEGGPVPIRAEGPVFRSYVHVEELMAVLMDRVRTAGTEPAPPFDSAGTAVVEIGDLARLICDQLDVDPARIARRYDPEGRASRYVGDGDIYRGAVRSLGLAPIGLDAIVADSIESLRRRSD